MALGRLVYGIGAFMVLYRGDRAVCSGAFHLPREDAAGGGIVRIAMITGASGGMGEVFAEHIDREEKGIDEIWLIARRKDRLEEVAARLKHPTRVLPTDLCNEEDLSALEATLAESNVRVGLFVHCAGFGKIGTYETISRADTERMIDLDCKFAVSVTLIALPFMRAGDRIVELCSASSFFALPHLATYAASKNFLLSYTQALRMELLPRGIVVTAVCPWWVG
ncbi:MAG: SDR family NAD(P)-dependent oxidoreductase, partial [Coriobacteriaceae bacterium]|nr:SDR family NAD(P)-dependent oxidoreductase [Coriobacteriaceae bacterium]